MKSIIVLIPGIPESIRIDASALNIVFVTLLVRRSQSISDGIYIYVRISAKVSQVPLKKKGLSNSVDSLQVQNLFPRDLKKKKKKDKKWDSRIAHLKFIKDCSYIKP